ncbi:neuronal acetylcholine receptor subunit alpha-7-like isoform X2 [Episyrphus balteatus]|uniref:neuronal acetylcholine receptor subunit alpha-7-like isoform X2 n=1 Tax=Episyrphus balteatus TaxID=286459 RepID=UPI0024865F4C|nr:neuronal acetylcholine receptor subunit alpha-7-like isoform X2 [Episyrphus balteatus]
MVLPDDDDDVLLKLSSNTNNKSKPNSYDILPKRITTATPSPSLPPITSSNNLVNNYNSTTNSSKFNKTDKNLNDNSNNKNNNINNNYSDYTKRRKTNLSATLLLEAISGSDCNKKNCRDTSRSSENSIKSSRSSSSKTSHSCFSESNNNTNNNNKHLHKNTTSVLKNSNKFNRNRNNCSRITSELENNQQQQQQQIQNSGSSEISGNDDREEVISRYNDSDDSRRYYFQKKKNNSELDCSDYDDAKDSDDWVSSCCSNERLHESKRRTGPRRRRKFKSNSTSSSTSTQHLQKNSPPSSILAAVPSATSSSSRTSSTTIVATSVACGVGVTSSASPRRTSSWSQCVIAAPVVLAIRVFILAATRTLPPLVRIQRGIYGLNKYSWIFLLIYLNLSAKFCIAGYHEKKLLHDLLDPYNTLERPVLNESDPLQLSFGLTLMQIIDVDEKNQLLVTNVWLKLEWNDMNLRWNTSDYGGVKDLRIPPHRIWKPDVLMYNSADEGFDGTYQTNVVVRSNGSCLYVPPGIFKSTCKIDITWFPFDDQRCEMKFGSWTYDGFQLDLQLQDETGGDISSYVLNGEWELLGVPGKRNEIYYNCCPEPYIDITFAIIIRRRTLYYFFNLIIPCVLIASMALLGFTLPPDSGEKLSLGVTILLSLTVFLNMVAETMPATSDAVPLLGTYFNCIMFMVASSVVSTILILNYHHRNANTHEMSEWIRIIFLCWLPWILRMSRPGRPLILEFPPTPCSDTSSERKHQILSDVELKERSSKSLLANVLDIDDDFRHNCRPMTPGGTLPHNTAFYRTVYGQGDDGSIGPIGSTRMPDAVTHHTCIKSSTEYELGLILKEIRFITDQLRKEDEDNDIANDWKFAAMVVDRLCLIIFTMFTILATIAVLLSAPHIIVS